jgi:hypothetical protein
MADILIPECILSLGKKRAHRNSGSEIDAEGWDLWLGIFGISKKKIILNQES